ncbi:MAG: SAM-dependent methyltransferase [Nibricoccus sp.]
MPTSAAQDRRPSPEFQAVFRAEAGEAGAMSFDRFMSLALYHPAVGYYRAEKKRVGYGRGTDFYTATSTGPLFGELVHAACRSLLGQEKLKDYTFVELGAEPGAGILAGAQHSFGATRNIRIGETVALSGRCVVFSNELFDAQPFRRLQFQGGSWYEMGVQLLSGELREIALAPVAALTSPSSLSAPGAIASLFSTLPTVAPEGYRIDLPLASVALAEQISAQPWTGLFLAFDYGKSWRELIAATPAGTARAYFQHQQSNDLLARPGQQDLTCHICWDWLADKLAGAGFAPPQLETQEAFLIRRAADFMSATVAAEASQLSQRKLGLLQLLHHLGQKFQVLWALRQ